MTKEGRDRFFGRILLWLATGLLLIVGAIVLEALFGPDDAIDYVPLPEILYKLRTEDFSEIEYSEENDEMVLTHADGERETIWVIKSEFHTLRSDSTKAGFMKAQWTWDTKKIDATAEVGEYFVWNGRLIESLDLEVDIGAHPSSG